MEFEDSRLALFPEPNAYIQKFNTERETKKVIFQEPYEMVPNFYLNNNFKKHDCDCVKNKHDCSIKSDYDNYNHSDCNTRKEQCEHNKSKGFGFDLKKLLPLIGMFNKGGGADLNSFVGLLNNANSQGGENSNIMSLFSNLISNKDSMSGILNLFKGGGFNLFQKKQKEKKELKTTDFEIKNYTRVE